MKLHELKASKSAKQSRKRVGRGDSSGLGRTCGRGDKGQKSRSGATSRPHFEGGQIPFFRRLPKRGFKSLARKEYSIVNIATLEENFEADASIDLAVLQEKGIVGKTKLPLKVLGSGEMSKAFTVKAVKFSETAKSKIEAAGGKCELI